MRRHELSDAQWESVADLVPDAGRQAGGRWRDHRQVVSGLMWKLATGAQWRDLPERYGPWQTIYERFSRWRREGLPEAQAFGAAIGDGRTMIYAVTTLGHSAHITKA